MERREQMRALLARRERSGLTFAELSRESGIPTGTLASWAWKLRQESDAADQARSSRQTFVEVVEAPLTREVSPRTGRIEIVLARDRRVVVDAEVDDELLARVVRTLERC